MDWTTPIDGYCERTDPSYWSEPINAITNLAFLVVAIYMWRRSEGFYPARFLSAVLFAIGIGSYLFHTHATPWAAALDVLPIAVFSLSYIFLANRDYWQLPVWVATLGAVAYFPYAFLVGSIAASLPFFEISAQYWPLAILIAAYGIALWARAPETGRGLLIGSGLLVLSLISRSVDEILCISLPFGTHFIWHILNAVMLGWMIEVWRLHAIGKATEPR